MSPSMLSRNTHSLSVRSHARVLALAVTAPVAITLLGAGLDRSLAQETSQSAMTVQVSEENLFFNPNSITIPANTPIAFQVTNDGAVRHNFSVTDHDNAVLANLNVAFDTDPGQSGSATLNAPAGVYYFFCNEPGHEQAGMFGYITVADDANVTTPEATVTPRAG